MPQYTAIVDGIAARMPQEGHLLAQHLYVHDGDVKTQDATAKRFEALAVQDEKAFEGMIAVLSDAPDAETQAAAAGIKKLRDGYVAMLSLSRKAIEASRKETVANVDERVASRALYTEQLLKLQEQIGAGVAASSKGTLTYAAGEGEKASEAIAATKREILIAAILSVLVARRARHHHHALGHAPRPPAPAAAGVAQQARPRGALGRPGGLRRR